LNTTDKDTTGQTAPLEITTLRSLRIEACQHPLLIGSSPRDIINCPFCGARLVKGKFEGGSIDMPIRPPFDRQAKAISEKMDEEDSRRPRRDSAGKFMPNDDTPA
jgi:hypothetical protein